MSYQNLYPRTQILQVKPFNYLLMTKKSENEYHELVEEKLCLKQ